MNATAKPAVEAERSERAATWAVRLVNGAMPADHEKDFMDWLDADSLNGDALEEVIGAWRAVEHYAANEQMVALRQSALASARRTSRRPKDGFGSRGLVLACAAVLLLMLGGLGIWSWSLPRLYETGVGERRVVALSDGSKVSLDAATVVKVKYSRDKRQLWLLRGRAKFDVAKDYTRPFSVSAARKVVVATGTAFSVELLQKQVRVVLYKGRVVLFDKETGAIPSAITAGGITEAGAMQLPSENLLKPGKELIMSNEHATLEDPPAPVLIPADPVASLSWEGGQLVFVDEGVGVVVERMNRYAAIPLAVADAATASVRLSGVFRAGDTEALVQGLSATFHVHSRNTSHGVELFTDTRTDSRR